MYKLPVRLMTLAHLAVATTALAQAPTVTARRGSCQRCYIDTATVTVLGPLGGVPGIGAIDSRGRYHLVLSTDIGAVEIFGRSGTHLRAVTLPLNSDVGFRNAYRLLSHGDSVLVFDRTEPGLIVVGPDLTVTRTAKFPVKTQDVSWAGQNRMVVNADVRTPHLVGFPLHVVTDRGLLQRSFGSPTGVYRPDIPHFMRREIAVDTATGIVWAARRTEYLIEGWEYDAETLHTRLRRHIADFPPWFEDGTRRNTEGGLNRSVLRDLAIDSGGNLRVLLSVPDPRRASATAERTVADGNREIEVTVPTELKAFYDTIVEILDPESGAVISSARLDDFASMFLNADHIVVASGSREAPFVVVKRIELIK